MSTRRKKGIVRKTCTQRRKISLLKERWFEEKVIKLVNIGLSNLRGHFKHGVLKACDEVCGKRRGGGEVKETRGGGMQRRIRQC